MTLDDLQTLLDFHYWARDRVLDAAVRLTPEQFTQDLGGSFQSGRNTLVHIYTADWAWDQLWRGVSPAPAAIPQFEQFPNLDSIRLAWTAQESKTELS